MDKNYINTFFADNTRAALAFSGGVDSAYLLYLSVRSGAQVCAYYVRSPFQPEFEYQDALRLAGELGAEMKVLPLDVLEDPAIASNPGDRCYHCKKRIFTAIMDAASAEGYSVLMDGTNASDDASDRPGMRALEELSVRSPLREGGYTKADIRRLSREAGLFTWNKPSYACLATRVPAGTAIDKDILKKTEKAENYLMTLGFKDFRVRYFHGAARIQLPGEQFETAMDKREMILAGLSGLYDAVMLDLEDRD